MEFACNTCKTHISRRNAGQSCSSARVGMQWLSRQYLSSLESNFCIAESICELEVVRRKEDSVNTRYRNCKLYLGARILRCCARQLALLVVLLARSILNAGRWPKSWKVHWMSPLHKRDGVYNPDKHRGLHLTQVLSKVVERMFVAILVPFFCASGAYGSTQWAFQKGL